MVVGLLRVGLLRVRLSKTTNVVITLTTLAFSPRFSPCRIAPRGIAISLRRRSGDWLSAVIRGRELSPGQNQGENARQPISTAFSARCFQVFLLLFFKEDSRTIKIKHKGKVLTLRLLPNESNSYVKKCRHTSTVTLITF